MVFGGLVCWCRVDRVVMLLFSCQGGFGGVRMLLQSCYGGLGGQYVCCRVAWVVLGISMILWSYQGGLGEFGMLVWCCQGDFGELVCCYGVDEVIFWGGGSMMLWSCYGVEECNVGIVILGGQYVAMQWCQSGFGCQYVARQLLWCLKGVSMLLWSRSGDFFWEGGIMMLQYVVSSVVLAVTAFLCCCQGGFGGQNDDMMLLGWFWRLVCSYGISMVMGGYVAMQLLWWWGVECCYGVSRVFEYCFAVAKMFWGVYSRLWSVSLYFIRLYK